MRCSHCGQPLDGAETTCSRCGASNDSATRRRDLCISLVVALIAVAFVALLVFVVLNWYTAQQLAIAAGNASAHA